MPNYPEKAWQAAIFAVKAHDGIKRGGVGVPYATHVLDVARRLALFTVTDEDVLAAACLHDTVEDTKVTIEEIEREFGERVAILVAQLTLPKECQDDYVAKVEHQSRMMGVMGDDGRLIKIADKWSNVSDLLADPPNWGKKAFVGYAKDSRAVVNAGVKFSTLEYSNTKVDAPLRHDHFRVMAMAAAFEKSVDDVLRRHG